jgi:hypothetical protein
MRVFKPQSAYETKKGDEWSSLTGRIAALASAGECDAFWQDFLLSKARVLPADWAPLVRDLILDRRGELYAEQLNRRLDAIVGDIARNG